MNKKSEKQIKLYLQKRNLSILYTVDFLALKKKIFTIVKIMNNFCLGRADLFRLIGPVYMVKNNSGESTLVKDHMVGKN